MSDEKKQAWFALWVLFGINTMNFFDRQILAAVTEPIRKEWVLSDTEIGWLGTAFTLIYAAVGVPLGRLADRWTRTRILSIGVAVWSLLTAASGLAWNYWVLFATRLGVGVGEASCAPAGNSLIGDLYPADKRGRAISIFMLGLPIGIFLSNLLSGIIAFNYGWRMTFYLACLPGLTLALLALLVREPKRGASEAHAAAGREHEGSPYWRVFSIPTMWWIIISGALQNFNAYAINGFLPAFLSRYHSLNVKEANRVSAYVLGAVGVLGLLGGGWAADRVRRSRANGRMLLAAVSVFVAAPCIYLALERPKGDLTAFMFLIGTGWMLTYVYYVTVYATIQDVVEPRLRGTAMALYFFAMYVLGASFGTLITGGLSDYFAHRAMLASGASQMAEAFKAAGLHSAMYVIPLLCSALGVVLWAASRTVAADMEKLQRWMRESAAERAPRVTAEPAAVEES